jgi:crotonobetainyl-CoA:carnitine CoA-transferase CaiB-like acyl-CoA transferase
VSTSAAPVASRVMTLVGLDDPRFATSAGRVEHRDEVDRVVREWIAARSSDEVLAAFETAQAAIAPVMTMGDIDRDPHYLARDAIVEVDGVPMQGLIAHLSKTPGRIRWAGRPLDADGKAIRESGW